MNHCSSYMTIVNERIELYCMKYDESMIIYMVKAVAMIQI